MKNKNNAGIKKRIAGVMFVTFAAAVCIHLYEPDDEQKNINIYDDVLRFHVIANSDDEEDQALKMKVKSVVASKISADMLKENIENASQAKKFVGDHSQEYVRLAKETIYNEGYDYGVTTTLGKHWFPIRIYGDDVYPEGEYEAYRMIIGKGEGKNWWCVLFPSLCMVDGAYGDGDISGDVTYDRYDPDSLGETEKEGKEKEGNVEIRFAFVEWLKHMW